MMSRSKPLNDLSLDAFRLALSIVEGPSLKVSGARLMGAPSSPFKRLRDLGALVHKERATTIICQECHRRHRATVTFDRERRTTTYFCSEAGRVTVEPAQLDVYEFQLDWLLNWIAKAHRIAARQRPIPRVEDHLWEVGEATIEGYRIRIFFARRIGSPQVLERLEQRLLSLACKGKTGVVLTASAGFVVPRRLPSAFSIVQLSEVIEVADKGVSIDRQRLLGIVEPEATVDRYRTGLAGRPTAKHLFLPELERRIKSGEAFADRAEEANYLITCFFAELSMTISWNKVESKLHWITNWNKPVAMRSALGFAVIMLIGVTSHAVVAQPWRDHGALAHTMTQEAACAGAEKLLRGGTPLEIKEAAIDRLVKGGFRSVHGYRVLVTHRSIDHGTNGAVFPVAVSIVHQDKHYLLEELIDYRPSWAVQSVTVDEANFDQCSL